MKEITIRTQNELDKLPLDQKMYIYIEGGTETDPLVLKTNYQKAEVIVRGSAYLSEVYGSATIGSVSDSATIRNVSDSATIGYVYDSATIGSVYGSATIRNVYDSATIRYVSGSATIGNVSGSATIGNVSGSATIGNVYDSATIGSVYDSATIRSVSNSATIRYVYDLATIRLSGEATISGANSAKKIVCSGYNTVIVHKADQKKLGLVMNKTSNLVILPYNSLQTKPTFEEYAKRYPVNVNGKLVTLYKAVHKKDGRYFSHNTSTFEYKIGEVKEHECAPASEGSCSAGLHVSVKYWALQFGDGWDDIALLECEVPIKNIVVCADTDGKVRTSKLKVVREVPATEYWL